MTIPAATRSVSRAGRAAFAPWLEPGRQPLIRLDGVTRDFGQVRAVDGVTLDIHAGEIFCLLGPSGCGKTTLMRMLAGFDDPDRGRILLDGADLVGQPPHLRPVNMMFQSYALFPHLSVADNVAFGLRQQRLGRGDIADRVARLLALVELTGLERRKPDALSGGQKQRVALARALARQPKVLLLDEPLGALDRRTRERTQFELMAIQRELGTTFLVVTHDQDEAMVLADRIAVMEAGKVIQVGPPRSVYEEPQSRAVASFLGDINLIEARVTQVAPGSVVLACPGFGAVEVAAPNEPVEPGRAVALAIRPEKLRLTPGEGLQGPNRALCRVTDIGYRGDGTLYSVAMEEGPVLRVSQINADREMSQAIGLDDVVTIAFSPTAALVLTR